MEDSVISKVFFLFGISIFLLISVAVNGCKDNSTNSYNGNNTHPDNEIWMQNTAFTPGSKTISKGTKLTWINKDSFAHTVTSGSPGSPDGTFDSGNLNAGTSFSYTFSSAGIFKYYCKIHGSIMVGTITVQ